MSCHGDATDLLVIPWRGPVRALPSEWFPSGLHRFSDSEWYPPQVRALVLNGSPLEESIQSRRRRPDTPRGPTGSNQSVHFLSSTLFLYFLQLSLRLTSVLSTVLRHLLIEGRLVTVVTYHVLDSFLKPPTTTPMEHFPHLNPTRLPTPFKPIYDVSRPPQGPPSVSYPYSHPCLLPYFSNFTYTTIPTLFPRHVPWASSPESLYRGRSSTPGITVHVPKFPRHV